MQQEELDKVHKLVNSSSILTPDEKKEWVQLLPEMNHKQVLELIKILSENEPAKKPVMPTESKPAQPQITQSKNSWHLPVDLNQKELATSLPEYELELPPPHKQPPVAPQPVAKPNAEVDPTEVQKKVEEIMAEMRKPKMGDSPKSAAPSAPVPGISPSSLESLLKANDTDHLLGDRTPQTASAAPVAHKVSTSEPLVLKRFEDLSGLNPNMLHVPNPREVYQKILNTIPGFVRKHSAYAVVSQIEASRLYKTYVSMGIRLLNDINADRDLAYKKIMDEAMHTGNDYLTKEEFELFVDFRKELDKF
jgi:hypothetical protein